MRSLRFEVAELEVTARERYDDLVRLYILPTLGDMLASKLDAELWSSAELCDHDRV